MYPNSAQVEPKGTKSNESDYETSNSSWKRFYLQYSNDSLTDTMYSNDSLTDTKDIILETYKTLIQRNLFI